MDSQSILKYLFSASFHIFFQLIISILIWSLPGEEFSWSETVSMCALSYEKRIKMQKIFITNVPEHPVENSFCLMISNTTTD